MKSKQVSWVFLLGMVLVFLQLIAGIMGWIFPRSLWYAAMFCLVISLSWVLVLLRRRDSKKQEQTRTDKQKARSSNRLGRSPTWATVSNMGVPSAATTRNSLQGPSRCVPA